MQVYVQGEKVREKYDIVLKKSFYKYNNLNTCYVLELWVNLFDKVLMFAYNQEDHFFYQLNGVLLM